MAGTTRSVLLTVEEAAAVLGVGRSAAYALARLWEDTGGRAGLPTVRVGRSRRVPVARLEELIGRPITEVPTRTGPRRHQRPGR